MDIKQAANRLENASTTSERVAALQTLQSLARQNCSAVGAAVLQFVLEMLKENGESDEYVEALELISKLVKPKNGEAAVQNAQIVIKDVMNVELLLDLLEHEDGLVGVMSSEILTNLHAVAGGELDATIQDCPAGLTKLLNRMPDRSREEVSNQAIILIRQLTSSNEEMKKTVAFNEGFETIFGVIESEGGYKEANAVVQDCLEICCNVLDGSEICQRLFYDMGGGWHFKLLDFFSPVTVEVLSRKPPEVSISAQDGEGEDQDSTFMDFPQHGPWYEQTGRLRCAVLGSHCLEASMGPAGDHHVAVASAAEHIISSCAHWIVRGGPAEMLPTCFAILNSLATGPEKKSFALRMFSTILRYSPSANGLNIPTERSAAHIQFSWKLPGADEKRAIAIPNLFAERYLFPVQCWWGHESSTRTTRVNSPKATQGMVYLVGNEFWMGSLRILESMLAADETTSGMLVQNILAPPPPPMEPDEDGLTGFIDNMQMEFGSLVLSILLNSLDRVIVHQGGSSGAAQQSLQADATLAVRAANIMCLVLVHGGLLARELSTAVCTVHIATQRTTLDASFKAQNLTAGASMPILPYLLSLCSRVVRVPGVGFTVACAVFRLLTAAACKCERASTQMLDDPANFFVVDLASRNSESAGVPEGMQISCCLFLGACFDSFPPHVPSADAPIGIDNRLSRTSILSMVDSKIGLSRFSDLLKRPSMKTSRTTTQDCDPEDLYFCDSFRVFYLKQIESIRTAIYDFYSGSTVAGGVATADTPEGQVISMQKETIAELQDELRQYQQSGYVSHSTTAALPASLHGVPQGDKGIVEDLRLEIAQMNEELSAERIKSTEWEAAYREENQMVKNMAMSETTLVNEVEDLRIRLEEAQHSIDAANEQVMEHVRMLKQQTPASPTELPEHVQEKLNALLAENEQLRREIEARIGADSATNGGSDGHKDEEILMLKEKIVNLSSAKKSLNEEVDTLNRKLVLLEEDLLTPMPYEKVNTSKITDLEARNASLKTEIWEMESSMASMKCTMDSDMSLLKATIATLVELIEVEGNDCLIPSSECSEGAALPQLLARMVEECVDTIQSAAGRCSDIGEGIGLRYDTAESKAIQRCIEVVDKACMRMHDAEIKIQEGESIRNQLEVAETELQALQDSYDAISSKLEEVELECEKLRARSENSEGSASQEKAAVLFENIASLQTALTEKEGEITQLKSALKRSSEQLETDASHSAAVNEVIGNFSGKMENMQQSAGGTVDGDSGASRELSILQKELKGALDENIDLAEKVADYDRKLHEAAETLESKTIEYEEVLAELEKLRMQQVYNEKEHVDAGRELEELRRTMLEQDLEMSKTVNALRAQLEWVAADSDSMSTALQAAEEERDSLKQQLTELEMTNRQTVELLQTHYRLVTEKSSKLLEYEEALRRGEEKDGEGLEAMMDRMMKLEIQVKEGQDEIMELEAKIVTIVTELDKAKLALDEKIIDYNILLTEVEKSKGEQTSWSNRSMEVAELYSKSEEQLAALSQENNMLSDKLADLEEAVGRLNTDNIELQDRLTATDEAAYANRTQLRQVIEEKNALVEELGRYEEKLQDVRTLPSGCDGSIESREELEQMKREIRSAKDEMDHLKDIIVGKDKQVSELLKEVDQKDAECVQLRATLKGKASEYSKVLEKFLKLKEQLGSVGSAGVDVGQLQADYTQLSQESSELRRKLQQSEVMREQLMETANAQAGKIAGYDQIIACLEADIDSLTEAKEAAEDACKVTVADLEKKVELLSREISSKDGYSDSCRAEFKALRDNFAEQAVAEMNQQSSRVDSALERATLRLACAQKGVVLVSAAIRQQKNELVHKERDIAEKESRLQMLEQRLTVEAAATSMTPPSKLSVAKYTTSPVTAAIGSTPSHVRENARLQAEVRKEVETVKEQHTDLLGLLAQQEIELQVFRDALLSCGGACACEGAEGESRRIVTERYGSYVAFRSSEEKAVVI